MYTSVSLTIIYFINYSSILPKSIQNTCCLCFQCCPCFPSSPCCPRLATSRPLGERSEPFLAAKRPTASDEVARGRPSYHAI